MIYNLLFQSFLKISRVISVILWKKSKFWFLISSPATGF
eukprot:UN16603